MDFANRGNRPTQTPQQNMGQQEQTTQSFQPVNNDKKAKKRVNFGKIASILLLVASVLLVAAVIFMLVFGENKLKDESDLIQTDKYQALFLNSQDGQVYFGKLAIYNDDLYELTDIYYVRVETPVQPEGEEASNTPRQNISLAKLGNELHGPQDAMYVSRDQVLYWENLKDEGQVVTAIKEFKANGGNTSNQNTQNNTNTDQTQNQNNDATQTEETTNP